MKTPTFVLASTAFARIVGQVSPVIPTNSIVPSTDCVLLTGRGTLDGGSGTLYAVATNLESRLVASTAFECRENFAVMCDAKLLLSTLRGFPDTPVSAYYNQESYLLELRAGSSKYKIAGMSPTDFPKSRKLADEFKAITLPAATLHSALAATLAVSAVSIDAGRPFTNGILVETTNHYLAFVAYSDNRLCAWTAHNDTDEADAIVWPSEPTKFLLSRSSANLLYNLLDAKSTETVTLQIDPYSVRLADNSWQTRPMDHPYPEWAKMIPAAAPVRHLTAERDDLVAAVRRLQGYTPTQTQLLVFDLNQDDAQFTLKASDPYIGNEGEEIVYGEYFGDNMSIGFPAKRLLDLLILYPAGRIRLAFVAENTGAMITAVADEDLPNLTTIIAAMRVIEPAI